MSAMKASLARPDTADPLKFEILLKPGFVGLEVTSVIDTLRIANRIAGKTLFAWTTSAESTGPIEGAGGYYFKATGFESLTKPPDVLIVPGNRGRVFLEKSAINRILRLRREGSRIILLAEAAAEFIASQKSMRGPVTTHWENKLLLLESYVDAQVSDAIAERFEGFTTAAGMGTTIDLMLHLLGEFIPASIVRTVSAVLLHERLRPLSTMQPALQSTLTSNGDPVIQRAIELMQTNLDADMSLISLASQVRISLRSLERKFNKAFMMSPAAFFRELRLNKALQLITSTNLPLIDIAISCGLHSTGNLSKSFKARFNMTPMAWRKLSR
jgi:transcriptional regulator GlxA family with amidase domain